MSIKPSALKVLRLLQAHQPHAVHATTLSDPGIGGTAYRVRIDELRESGIVVRTEAVPGRTCKAYRLLGNPATC